MILDLDNAIIVSFLALILVSAIIFSHNIDSMRKYALGNQNFSTGVLAATFAATWIGGGFFSVTITNTYTEGWNYMVLGLGEVIAFVVLSVFVAPRVGLFLGSLSVAESMGKIFDKRAQIITALVGIGRVVGTIAIQFKVCSTIFQYFFGIDSVYATWISCMLVVIYSALGGIKAVIITDIIQFATFIIFIPIFSMVIWGTVDDPVTVVNTINTNSLLNFESFSQMSGMNLYNFIALVILFIIPGLDPAIFQRLIISKDATQARLSLNIAASAFLFVLLITFWIAILLISKAPNLGAEDVIGYIIDNYTYRGLKGFLIVGVLAMLMSTADSYLNSASVLFAHDFCVPLNLKWAKNNELLLSKITTIITGILSLIMAISTESLFEIITTIASFYMPLVTVPLFLTIFGFRTSSTSYLFGISIGIALTIIPKFVDIGIPGPIVTVFSIIAVAISIIGFHYLFKQNGGWHKIKTNSSTITVSKNTCVGFYKNFSLTNIFRSNAPKNEVSYVFISLFFIASVFSTMYSIRSDVRKEHQELLEFIYHSVLIISAAFLTYPIWPPRFKNTNLSITLWFMGLFYVLIFVGFLQAIISSFGQFQLMIFLLGIVVLSAVLRWQTAIFLIIGGISISIISFKCYTGMDVFRSELGGGLQFKIAYFLLMITSILVMFFKPKQDHLEATEAKLEGLEMEITDLDHTVDDLNNQVNHYSEKISDQEKEIERLGATAQKILNNVNHELRLPVGNVMNFSEMLYKGLGKHSPKMLKELSDQVYKNTNRLSTMILNMLDLANLEVKKVNLEKTLINFSEIVKTRVKTCRNIYLQGKPINFKLMIDPEIMISVDPNYMRQAIDNLVINAINFSEEGTIVVKLEKQKNFIQFTITDQGIGIPKEDIYDIFTPFKMGSNIESKAEGRGVGLALCKSIVEAHDGKISASSKGTGAVFRFVLPSRS